VPDVVVFGTASRQKHDVLREHGCAHCIDYRNVDYVEEVKRLTEGAGVDLVLDPLGGKNWRRGYELLKPAGMLVAYGFASIAGGEKRSLFRIASSLLSVPRFSPMSLMDENRAVAGVNMGHLWTEAGLLTTELVALLRLYREGKIRPVIDQVFPFAEAAAAHRRITERVNVGKIVLTP
jgi:NADPH:quinone reductase-like Zn-dependent oxidoreductase